MGNDVGRVVAGIMTGGLSEVFGAGKKMMDAPAKAAEKAAKVEALAQKKLMEEEARNKKQAAMRIRRGQGAGDSGKTRSTILTSPLGVIGGTNTGGKTLLGQ